MSSVYDEYATDTSLENDGVWVEFRGGLQLKIRSDNSIKTREWAVKRAKGQRALIVANSGLVPPSIADKNEIDQLAEVTVVDARHLTDRQGQPLEYSRETIRQLMKDLPGLRRDVLLASKMDDTFAGETAEMGKISAPPSPPPSASEATPSA